MRADTARPLHSHFWLFLIQLPLTFAEKNYHCNVSYLLYKLAVDKRLQKSVNKHRSRTMAAVKENNDDYTKYD